MYALAFACEPGRGSEPGAGFSMAEALARLSCEGTYDIVLLTRDHRLSAVSAALAKHVPQHEMQIVSVNLPLWLVALTKRKRVRYAYVVWQLLAVCKIWSFSRQNTDPFLVHHVTFATEALPTFEGLLGSRSRLVFGPAGSSQQLENSDNSKIRNTMRAVVRDYFGRTNMRYTRLALGNNDYAAARFAKFGARETIVEPNIVVPSFASSVAPSFPVPEHLLGHELICVGLLRELKRIDWAIRALSLMSHSETRLLIIGDGPLESSLRQLCDDLGLAHRVTFAGKLDRQTTLALIARAQVLVHASRQEGSAWAVGEAQSVGTTPVVVSGSGCEATVRLGGFGLVVKNSVSALAVGMDTAFLAENREPTNRWSDERLPKLLNAWYSRSLS